ncbi:MAG: transposase [Chloroflexota bacterium]
MNTTELPGGGQRTAQDMIALIRSAPVFSEESARTLVAEVGLNFPEIYGSADALVRMLGLTPGNRKSAGKVVGTEAIPGNQHYKPIIVQAVTTFLRRQTKEGDPGWSLWLWGRRYQQRSDAQHARIAVARKITRSVYFMCRKWEAYDDSQHRLVQEDHALQTDKRLANTAQALAAADIVGLETAAQLKQANQAINQALGIRVSRYKLCPFDHDFSVQSLGLSTRIVNILLKNDILSVGQLILRVVSGNCTLSIGWARKQRKRLKKRSSPKSSSNCKTEHIKKSNYNCHPPVSFGACDGILPSYAAPYRRRQPAVHLHLRAVQVCPDGWDDPKS